MKTTDFLLYIYIQYFFLRSHKQLMDNLDNKFNLHLALICYRKKEFLFNYKYNWYIGIITSDPSTVKTAFYNLCVQRPPAFYD